MVKIKIFTALCMVGSLWGSGCASSRIVTDMKPVQNAELKSSAGTFYVVDLKFIHVVDNPSPQTTDAYLKYQRQLLPLLRKECVERYPALFANDSASSIPLGVTAETATTIHKFKMICWMYGTLMTAPLIFPGPSQMDEDVTLKAGIWTGREELQTAMMQKCFRREVHTWVSFLTPLALIEIPGESDFPKVSLSILDTQKGEQIYLQQLASQLATALAETIAAKDPAFWTTQPRLNNSSIGLPARPVDAPVAPPMPTDSPTPF